MKSNSRNARKVGSAVAAVGALLSATPWAQAQDPAAQPAVGASVSASATVQTEPVTLSATETTQPVVPAESPLDVKLDIGLGLRSDFTFDPDRDPADAPTYGVGYLLRPYVSGQVHRNIKFEGNLDSQGNNIRVLDALLKFEFNDYANFWLGHFLPPSDRANLSGPFFQNSWVYPDVHVFPAEFNGRDDGLAYWGQYAGGVVKWQLGFFGMAPAGTPDPRFAGRVTVNLFDPEPGYYNSSTYYGSKNILAFGATLQHQPAPEGADDTEANTLWSLDALFEQNLGPGVLDLEGAFYGFGGADQGTSFFVLGSFLFPERVGIGQFQPMLRLERVATSDGDGFDGINAPLDDDASRLGIDAGLHYIISGHNARLAATLRHTSTTIGDGDAVTDTVIILGGQIQAF
ncbi:MAG: hypothetical protein RL685_5864 [Pseudomonadota bacterium]|jgi:hypothetical protein